MKWFKHDSNAAIDAKIERLILNYGIEGYGLYFYCLELIARNVEKHNLTFELEHDAELIGSRISVHKDRVSEMMTFMCNIGLFENSHGIITCLKMATRTDEYTQKIIKSRGDVPTLSRQSPDNVRLNRIEENRIEESRGKNGKRFVPPSVEEIKKYCHEKNKVVDPEQFWNFYESKGWFVGKNKMKSWHHAIALWHSRNKPADCVDDQLEGWV